MALDDIVFDIFVLTEVEKNKVYWAVCGLVKNLRNRQVCVRDLTIAYM